MKTSCENHWTCRVTLINLTLNQRCPSAIFSHLFELRSNCVASQRVAAKRHHDGGLNQSNADVFNRNGEAEPAVRGAQRKKDGL
jgi:hypothetical protein